MESNEQNGKLRPVIAIDEGRENSQAVSMEELIWIYSGMTDSEQARTIDYLNQQNKREIE
jgi:flagellar motility protein MotE (MotC chaperone)